MNQISLNYIFQKDSQPFYLSDKNLNVQNSGNILLSFSTEDASFFQSLVSKKQVQLTNFKSIELNNINIHFEMQG